MPDFKIVIKVDSSGAVRSAKRVENQLKRTEAQGKKTQSALKKAFAGVAVGQGAVQSIRFLANFSQEMSTVKAITKATDAQFKELRNTAIDLGTTTRFTSKQAASGMLFLARSGFKTNQILEAIPGVLNLAQAGALDLGRAADIATNILKGFGLATSETTRVVDVLALAANSANTTVEQMGQAMKFVAPIAAGVRMSLEDTAGAIQVLSNAGIQASMAGTGLRRVIGALEGPTTAQEKVLNDLGLTTEEVKISQVGLAGALAKIRSRTNDVGVALKLFGQRGGPAATVMANLWEEMEKFGVANLAAEGTAIGIAKVMDDNLNGAILRVKSAFQGFLILLGDVEGVSALRTFLEGLANTLRFLAKNADGFNDALKVLIPAILFFSLSTDKAAASLGKFRLAMAASPFGVLLLILTALTVAFTLMKDEITLGGEGLITFGDIFRVTIDFINDAWSSFTGGMGGSFINLQDGWKGLLENMANMFLAMVLTLAQAFDKVAGFFIGLDKASALVIKAMDQTFANGFARIANSIIDAIGTAFKLIIDGWNLVAKIMGDPIIPEIDLEALKFDEVKADAIITVQQIKDAFTSGLGRDGLEGVILGILDEAERRKLDEMRRLGELAKEDEKLKPDPEAIFGGGRTADAGKSKFISFGEALNPIHQETELLKLNSREMEIQQGLIDINSKLKDDMHEGQIKIAKSALLELQQQREMAQVYDDIRGPQEDYIARQTAINELHRIGKISTEAWALALDQARINILNLNRDIDSGITRGLLKLKLEIQDLASLAEYTLTNAFRGAEDALVSFVTTGEADFSAMVDSMLADLTRLMIRQMMMNLLTPGGGGAANAIMDPGAFSGVGGFAKGGQFTVGGSGGTDSQFVPLAVTPGERVTVETPKQQKDGEGGGAAAPIIKIVNITDPSEIPAAMDSKEGEQIVLNHISRNRNIVRNSIS